MARQTDGGESQERELNALDVAREDHPPGAGPSGRIAQSTEAPVACGVSCARGRNETDDMRISIGSEYLSPKDFIESDPSSSHRLSRKKQERPPEAGPRRPAGKPRPRGSRLLSASPQRHYDRRSERNGPLRGDRKSGSFGGRTGRGSNACRREIRKLFFGPHQTRRAGRRVRPCGCVPRWGCRTQVRSPHGNRKSGAVAKGPSLHHRFSPHELQQRAPRGSRAVRCMRRCCMPQEVAACAGCAASAARKPLGTHMHASQHAHSQRGDHRATHGACARATRCIQSTHRTPSKSHPRNSPGWGSPRMTGGAFHDRFA